MFLMGGKGRRSRGGAAMAALAVLGACATGGCTRQYTDKIAEQERTIQRLREESAQYEQSLSALKQNEEILNRTIEAERQRATALADELNSAKAAPRPAEAEAGAPSGSLEADRAKLEGALSGSGASVDVRDGQLVVTLPTTIAFDSGSASLTSKGQDAVKKLSRLLKESFGGRTVSIEGHTDNEPVKKSKFGSNWRLSVERALAVQRFLEEGCSVSPDRLRVVGYGPYRPLSPNTTASAKQKNRRVELVILNT